MNNDTYKHVEVTDGELDFPALLKDLDNLEKSIMGLKAFKKTWERVYKELLASGVDDPLIVDKTELVYWKKRLRAVFRNLATCGVIEYLEE